MPTPSGHRTHAEARADMAAEAERLNHLPQLDLPWDDRPDQERHPEHVSDHDNDIQSAYAAAREYGGGR